MVHNRQVLDDLRRNGITVLDNGETPESLAADGIKTVVLPAHGCPVDIRERLSAAGIRAIDATCDILRQTVYQRIRDIESSGGRVVIIGDPRHAEVIAARSLSRTAQVVGSFEDIASLEPGLTKVVAICQTTITEANFLELANAVKLRAYPNLDIIDTRCQPVRLRQTGVYDLARRVDAMLILGGYDSSNTRSLARIAEDALPIGNVRHIDGPEALNETDAEWFESIERLGLATGTSAPENLPDSVIDKIRTLLSDRKDVIVGEG